MTAPPPGLDDLLAHADWLHRLGLQLCRDQHAAADAAQDALLAAVAVPPRHGGNVRGYLARTLRNLLQLQQRRQRRRLAREAMLAAAKPPFAASAAELAERAELHQFLGRCVLELPEPQRSCVLMHHFEGAPVATVGARCGLSEDAVRSHLRRARDTLRGKLTTGGDPTAKRAFAALLLSVPAASTAAVLAMAMPIKSLTAAAVAAVALLLWAPWTPVDQGPPPVAAANRASVARSDLPMAPKAEAADAPAHDVVASPRVAAATTGTLHVRVLWSDGTPGGGLRLIVQPDLDDLLREREVVTDASGHASLQDLPGDSGQLRVDWRRGAPFTIAAGQTTEVVVQMQPGVTVRGLVVDENGLPVPTARIWLSRWGGAEEGLDVGPVEPDGTFVLRDVPTNGSDGSYLAAFAPGRRVSTLTAILGANGSTQDVRIELREPGVSLIGHVRRPDGTPASGHRVLVGHRESKPFWRESVWRTSRPPLDTKCDEHGIFRAEGLQPGTIAPVWLHGDDTAPSLHKVPLPQHGELVHDFTVTAGATVRGRVTTGEGMPVADVVVYALADTLFEPKAREGRPTEPSFATTAAKTDAYGRYELPHVAPGTVTLFAKSYQPPRSDELRLPLRDGAVATWDAVLTAGTRIRGLVVDESGQPLVGWDVRAEGETQGLSRAATTDAQGRFELQDCGDEDWQVRVLPDQETNMFRPARYVRGVPAGTEGLRIVVPKTAIPCATIAGCVQLANDEPANGARLMLWHETSRMVEWIPGGFDGTFRSGPLPPGIWRACADCDGRRSPWTDRFVLRDGVTDLGTLVIGPGGGASFTVRNHHGTLFDGVDCFVIDPIEGHDLVVAVGHAKGGMLQLDNLRPGDYRVRTRHKDQPRFDVPFTVRAEATTEVAVTIPISIACVLVTKPGPRRGRQHLRFTWTRDGGTPASEDEQISARSEQRLSRNLLPGDYVLTISAGDGASSENRFTIAPSNPAGREVVITLP